ncbi:MAG: hypothetical protein WKF73_16665 [Nocardioidaceae bacterium]
MRDHLQHLAMSLFQPSHRPEGAGDVVASREERLFIALLAENPDDLLQ